MDRLVLLAFASLVSFSPIAAQTDTTEVVVLGVHHSAMLVAEDYQPAVFRAYFDRVAPDAICVERAPEEFARGSHYEFTYEIQHIAVPWARENGVTLCPFDWLPAEEDQLLAFGVDLTETPFLRAPGSYASFLAFGDSADLTRDLFYAEAQTDRDENRAWYLAMAERPRHDFARRLFLYRTFMQAMRVARAAQAHPGGRLLVIVGSMHKDDIERILADQPGVRVVQPPSFGRPNAAEVARAIVDHDLHAIATFNVLGLQPLTGVLNSRWIEEVVTRLERSRTPETALLRTRLDVVAGRLDAVTAAQRYEEIASRVEADERFTWDGVLDRRRLDSFFDPFGNLTVADRARLERARELRRAGRTEESDRSIAELAATLTPLKAAQLRSYWDTWVVGPPPMPPR